MNSMKLCISLVTAFAAITLGTLSMGCSSAAEEGESTAKSTNAITGAGDPVDEPAEGNAGENPVEGVADDRAADGQLVSPSWSTTPVNEIHCEGLTADALGCVKGQPTHECVQLPSGGYVWSTRCIGE